MVVILRWFTKFRKFGSYLGPGCVSPYHDG
jgi:hypothetical protein